MSALELADVRLVNVALGVLVATFLALVIWRTWHHLTITWRWFLGAGLMYAISGAYASMESWTLHTQVGARMFFLLLANLWMAIACYQTITRDQ